MHASTIHLLVLPIGTKLAIAPVKSPIMSGVPVAGWVSRAVNGICNLQILKGAGSTQSARMPKRSCKSLANLVGEVCEGPSERHNAVAEGDEIGRLSS